MTRQQARESIWKGMIFSVLIAAVLTVHILINLNKGPEEQVQQLQNITIELAISAYGPMKIEDSYIEPDIIKKESDPEFAEWVKPQIQGMVPVYGRYGIDYISMDDFELIAKTVYAEAETENFEGKVAVAEVILNRVESPNFPDTVKAVIKETNAFTTWSNGSIEKAPLDDECLEAVQEAVNERVFPNKVVYFREGHYHSFGEPYTVIDNHYFSSE